MSSAVVRVAGRRLDQFGPVSDLRDSTIWRTKGYSGDYEAEWSWSPPQAFSAGWLRRGALVEIVEGGLAVWRGFLGDPTPGDVWKMVAYGDGADTANYVSADPAASNINASLLTARTAGLRWFNYDNDFTGGSFTLAPGYVAIMLDAALDKVAASQGKVWYVTRGVGDLRAEREAPDWFMTPGSAYLGTTDENVVTSLTGFYGTGVDGDGNLNSWAYTTPAASVPPTLDVVAEDRLGGPRQAVLDLTSLGVLTALDAYLITANGFSQMGARTGWTNGFEMTATNSRRAANGVPAPMAVRAGDRIRIPGITDMQASTTFGTSVTVTAGKVTRMHERSDATDRVQVEPVGMVDRSFEATLAAAQAKYSRVIYL